MQFHPPTRAESAYWAVLGAVAEEGIFLDLFILLKLFGESTRSLWRCDTLANKCPAPMATERAHLDSVERQKTVGSSGQVLQKGSRAPSSTRQSNACCPSHVSALRADSGTGIVFRRTQIQYQTCSEVEMTAVAFPQ